MNVLIAEDESILANVLKEEFELAGFKVISSVNGEETLVAMRSKFNRPNIVLLDLLMPVMNGFQVLEEIKKDTVNNLAAIPVIVLSNLGQDEDIKKALKLGASDYYVKTQHPIAEVIEKVREFLEGGGGAV